MAPKAGITAFLRPEIAAIIVICALVAGAARAGENHHVLGFRGEPGQEETPEEWREVTYLGKRANLFSLETEEGRVVLRVRSLGSVSSLMTSPDVDLREFPRLSWHWKINRAVGMAREDLRDRNDSAARVRVVFGTEAPMPPPPMELARRFLEMRGIQTGPGEPPGLKIDYIWGSHYPAETVMDYPGARGHKVIFLQSGNERAGRWIGEERNLLKDYEECFGGAPEGLAGILVLSDTDRTNEGVTAFFSEIVLMRPEGS